MPSSAPEEVDELSLQQEGCSFILPISISGKQCLLLHSYMVVSSLGRTIYIGFMQNHSLGGTELWQESLGKERTAVFLSRSFWVLLWNWLMFWKPPRSRLAAGAAVKKSDKKNYSGQTFYCEQSGYRDLFQKYLCLSYFQVLPASPTPLECKLYKARRFCVFS